MAALRSSLVALSLALGACSVGEVPIGGADGGADNGAQSFAAMVSPLVTECAIPACHGGAQPPNLANYAQLAAKYKTKPGNTNILVTKGAMSVPVGMHSGLQYLSAAEQTTVAAWIDSL
jgi:hypothetical protein